MGRGGRSTSTPRTLKEIVEHRRGSGKLRFPGGGAFRSLSLGDDELARHALMHLSGTADPPGVRDVLRLPDYRKGEAVVKLVLGVHENLLAGPFAVYSYDGHTDGRYRSLVSMHASLDHAIQRLQRQQRMLEADGFAISEKGFDVSRRAFCEELDRQIAESKSG